MKNQNFSLKEAIEEYGIEKLRILYPNSKIQYSMPNVILAMSAGLILVNDDDEQDMIIHCIDKDSWESNPNYKIKLNPEKRYDQFVRNPINGEAVDVPMYLSTRKMYVSDFNSGIERGKGSVYIVTEDGYQLIYGVITEVISKEDEAVLEWGQNVLNSLPFHIQ